MLLSSNLVTMSANALLTQIRPHQSAQGTVTVFCGIAGLCTVKLAASGRSNTLVSRLPLTVW
jgi:hypothetical protein